MVLVLILILIFDAPHALGCSAYTFEKLSRPILDPDLDEMSGLVLGGLEPDTLVHIRDSGNDPLLVYTKRDGTIIGRYPFGPTATDPEEITRGACPWGGACIFVFDTGDNFHIRSERHIWAVEENTLLTKTPHTQKFEFHFPGYQALDVEAAVLVDKTFYFFAKERKHARVFALDSAVWKGEKNASEAKLITDLPITMITGAASTKDGKRLLLINWQGATELSKEGQKSDPKAADSFYPYRKKIKLKDLEQQEGITYDADEKSFLYTSEKKMIFSKGNYGIMRATCVP